MLEIQDPGSNLDHHITLAMFPTETLKPCSPVIFASSIENKTPPEIQINLTIHSTSFGCSKTLGWITPCERKFGW